MTTRRAAARSGSHERLYGLYPSLADELRSAFPPPYPEPDENEDPRATAREDLTEDEQEQVVLEGLKEEDCELEHSPQSGQWQTSSRTTRRDASDSSARDFFVTGSGRRGRRSLSPSSRTSACFGLLDTLWAYLTEILMVVCIISASAFVAWWIKSAHMADLNAPPPTPSLSLHKTPNAFAEFKRDLAAVKADFAGQDNSVWVRLRAALRPLLHQTYPSEPAAIVLASTDALTADCLAKKLARIVTKAYGLQQERFLDLSPSNLQSSSTAELKRLLESLLLTSLGSDKQPVVIFREVDSLPAEGALLLHAFCDNTHAPFKDAVYLFPVLLPEDHSKLTGGCDDRALKRLANRWTEGGLDADKTPALLSRIGNSVVCLERQVGLVEGDC